MRKDFNQDIHDGFGSFLEITRDDDFFLVIVSFFAGLYSNIPLCHWGCIDI